MKQALVSLIRTFVRTPGDVVVEKPALPVLSPSELRHVTGGPGVNLPKSGW